MVALSTSSGQMRFFIFIYYKRRERAQKFIGPYTFDIVNLNNVPSCTRQLIDECRLFFLFKLNNSFHLCMTFLIVNRYF